MKPIAIKPRLSEKAYKLSEDLNVYVFEIPKGTNSHAVKLAVATQYKVSVAKVRIAKTATKSRRIVRRRGRNTFKGQSSGVFKAYVTLSEGDKLPFFAAVKEQEEKEAKAAKKAGKSEKK